MVAGPEPDLWSGPEMRAEFWSFLRYAGPPTVSYALDAGVEIVDGGERLPRRCE